ncbi:MAG: hypothetical protein IPH11_15505 [Ignavibacteriales bacterium]|nr:hypothetical protein [Ignavibacteriales bacterium]
MDDEEEFEEKIIIVIEGGMVTEVYSSNATGKIIVVDMDCRKTGEDSITEFPGPRLSSMMKELRSY